MHRVTSQEAAAPASQGTVPEDAATSEVAASESPGKIEAGPAPNTGDPIPDP